VDPFFACFVLVLSQHILQQSAITILFIGSSVS